MNLNRSQQGQLLPAPRVAFLVFAYLLLLAVLYRDAFVRLWGHWQGEDLSYGMLVPLVVAYLIWERRGQLAGIPARPCWLGLAPFAFGIFLYWLGELGGEYYSLLLSFWFVVVGLCLIHLGWPKVRNMAFPLLLLLAMFPFPAFVNNQLTMRLKLVSSQVGVKLLQWYGMSAYREGNVIDLGFTQLQVVDACSGLRYLFPIIIMGLLLGYFFRLSWWRWALLVAVTVPLIILNNGLRIAATGILYQRFGPGVAEGFFHDFAGWFTFMAAFALLLPVAMVLRRGSSKTVADTTISSSCFAPRAPSMIAVALAVIALATSVVASHGIEFREKIPLKKALAGFPLAIDEWQGVPTPMERKFVDALDFADYALIDYRNPAGQTVNLYIAYYDSQRKGESIHSPSSCLPGGGWVFDDAGLVTIERGRSETPMIKVNRALIRKGDASQLTYYWFPQRGRQLTSMLEMKFFVFWDALTRQRTDGALVRLITPVGKDESVAVADARLQELALSLLPRLNEFLPGR